MADIQWTKLPFDFVTPAQVLSAGIVLPIVCIALVSLRFYVRISQKIRVGLDDWLIAVGVFFIVGVGACLITGERLGVMGYPTPVPIGTVASEAALLFLDAFILQAKIQFALQLLMCLAYAFVKTSVIFFCRRIFLVTKGGAFDWASMILVYVSVAWSIGFLLTLVFGCGKRVDLHWAPLEVIEQSGCDTSTPEKAMVISDFILDLFIIALPLPAIWNLVMSLKRKLAVTGIFLLGLMAIVASAVRMAIYLIVLHTKYEVGYDINRTATTMLWWSMLELSLAAIAACLPTLSSLARTANVKRIFSNPSGSSGSWGRWRSATRSKQPSLDSGAHSLEPMDAAKLRTTDSFA